MWTRKELKDKAKVSFKANYWKSVLVALLLLFLAGGAASFSGSAGSAGAVSSAPSTSSYTNSDVNVDIKDGKVIVDVDDGTDKVHVNLDADDLEDLPVVIGENGGHSTVNVNGLAGPGAVLFGLSFGLLLLVVMAIAIAISAFILNPLEVGAQRFFLRDLNQPAEVKEVAFAYDNNYMETVKTLFLRDLFIILWSLLLIVPGIYKSYEYRMIPFLMAEDPTLTKDLAFAESKRMMDGQKWNAFVLDLSFLGWNILSALTLGILGIFYVGPYQAHTNAALYEKLRYGMPAPDSYGSAAPNSYGYAAPVPPAPVAPGSYDANAWAAPVAQPTATNAAPVAPVAVGLASADQPVVVPTIVPASQPPVPPFAAVGYQPEAEADNAQADVMQAEPAQAEPAQAIDAQPADDQNDAAPDSPEA